MKYHKNAKLTIEQRREIALRISAGESVSKIAREYGTTRKTIYKWAGREDFKDRSSTPKKYCKPKLQASFFNINKDHAYPDFRKESLYTDFNSESIFLSPEKKES